MTIAIVTDSTCDLPQHIVHELGIKVIPLFINIGDKSFLDGVDITRKDFYTNLPGYTVHPTTGTPGMDAFNDAYQTLAEKGFSEILSIHISKKLSAIVNMAGKAAQEYERIPVTVRDSGQLSLGTGLQVEQAARMAADGKPMKEIEAALDDLRSRTLVAARLDTLEFLRRSGRMNGFIAGIGSLLQLKPILTMKNGMPGSERVRTTYKAEARLLKILEEHQPIEQFSLLHTNALEKAMAFHEQAAHLLPAEITHTINITPVLGAHLGPGAVGYAIVAKNAL
ncbi:MAG: DegV family protein [Chloroflexi bacterium]|nr:DegV family protein [Chloroflexota bacterium]